MNKKVKPIPEGYHTVTPYLAVADAVKAIEFYKKAFLAKEIFCMEDPIKKKVGHAEIQIGNSRVMLADEFPDMNFKGPQSIGGTPVHLHLYVEDVDQMADRAIKAGIKVLRPVADQFYGDRMGSFEDPFGHVWHISSHQEDLSNEEIAKRAAAGKKGH